MDFAKMIVTGLLFIMAICMALMAAMAQLTYCAAFPVVFVIFVISFFFAIVIILTTE